MALLSQPSSAAKTALLYITVGAMLIVWCGVWYVYLNNNPPETEKPYYWCTGFMITGLTLLVIGLGLGRIGRAARHAELPPEEVTDAMMNAEQNAAARAPMVAPVNPVAPVAAPNGVVPTTGGVPAGRIG